MHTTTTTTSTTNTTTKKTQEEEEGKAVAAKRKKKRRSFWEIVLMSFSMNSTFAKHTPFFCAKHGYNHKNRSGNQNVAIKKWVQVDSLNITELVFC